MYKLTIQTYVKIVTNSANWGLFHFVRVWNSIFRYKRPKRAVGLMYRTIFFFTNSCEPELAHRLQTPKMRRNSTSLDSCQHDDINIATVNVARRRWTAPLKPRKPCVKHFTTFYALLKHVSPKGDYFTPKDYFFCALGPLFCALVREEAIFAACKRCANEGFACMCKEKNIKSNMESQRT